MWPTLSILLSLWSLRAFARPASPVEPIPHAKQYTRETAPIVSSTLRLDSEVVQLGSDHAGFVHVPNLERWPVWTPLIGDNRSVWLDDTSLYFQHATVRFVDYQNVASATEHNAI